MRFSRLLLFVCIAICTISSFAHAQRQKLAVGSSAPSMDILQWINGEFKQSLAEVYVVEFWATWCQPCLKSIPHLTELQSEFDTAGLTIIGVSQEEPEVVEPFVTRMGSKMNYVVGIDKKGKTFRKWMKAAGLDKIPYAFIVDRSGVIQFIGSPLSEEFSSILKKVVSGRYNQAKVAEAAPVIAAAERSRAGQSWPSAMQSYKKAIAIDEMVFAELYIEQFKMLLLEKRDTDGAYRFANNVILSRGEKDPELLTWLADTIVLDTDLEPSQRRMDTAILAAETALKNARSKNDPKFLSSIAQVKFYNGEVDEAINFQRQAYFSARERDKSTYKEVLDGYRTQQ